MGALLQTRPLAAGSSWTLQLPAPSEWPWRCQPSLCVGNSLATPGKVFGGNAGTCIPRGSDAKSVASVLPGAGLRDPLLHPWAGLYSLHMPLAGGELPFIPQSPLEQRKYLPWLLGLAPARLGPIC